MQIASALAGFTLGEADILRKAMGKKKADVMATQKDKFLKGCADARRHREEGRARSGTRWSSSRATASTSRTPRPTPGSPTRRPTSRRTTRPTSWPRCSPRSAPTPTRWCSTSASAGRWASTCCRPTSTSPTCSSRVVGGDASRSASAWPRSRTWARARWRRCCARARAAGRFTSLFDFCERVDLRAVNRRVVESFIKSGSLRLARQAPGRALYAAIDRAMEAGQKQQRDREQGQSQPARACSAAATPRRRAPPERLPDVADWGEGERLAFEKESLGFFITGHPLERFRAELRAVGHRHHRARSPSWPSREVTVGGHRHRAAPHQDQEGRPHGHVRPRGPGGRRRRCWSSPRPTRRWRARLAEDEVVLVKGKAEAAGRGQAAPPRAPSVLPLEQAKLRRGALRHDPGRRCAAGTRPRARGCATSWARTAASAP